MKLIFLGFIVMFGSAAVASAGLFAPDAVLSKEQQEDRRGAFDASRQWIRMITAAEPGKENIPAQPLPDRAYKFTVPEGGGTFEFPIPGPTEVVIAPEAPGPDEQFNQSHASPRTAP